MAKKKTCGLGDDLELWDDEVWKADKSRRGKKSDVSPRNDLPVGHPLRSKRVVKCVPAGMSDMAVSDDGLLVSAING